MRTTTKSAGAERTEGRAVRGLAEVLAVVVAVLLAASAVAQQAPAIDIPAIEIQSLELSLATPTARIRVTASDPVTWTSYRAAADELVIEFPNTVPAPGLEDLESPVGPLRHARLELLEEGSRPLTRLVVASRGAAEHAVTAEGPELRIDLEPPAGASPEPAVERTTQAEPEPAEMAEEATPAAGAVDETLADARPPAPLPRAGTPEEPVPGPPPVGVAASQLQGVSVESVDGATLVQVQGDGEFRYSTFRLAGPERFVIDLEDVVNNARASTVVVDDPNVERVRMAQFRPRPEPVSRVVIDLKGAALPTIRQTSDGLLLRFGGGVEGAGPVLAEAEEPDRDPVDPARDLEAEVERELAAGEPPLEAGAMPEPGPAPEERLAAAEPADALDDERGELVAGEVTPGVAQSPAAPAPAPENEMAAAPPAAAQPPLEEEMVEAPPAAAGATSDIALYEAAQVELAQPVQEDESVYQSYGSETISGADATYSGEPITLTLRDADIKDVLRSFADISGLNVVLQPGVSGTVTVELKKVPWDQALEQILKINNLGYELDGNIMRIAPVSKLRQEAEEEQRLRQAQALSIPLRTVIQRVSYADAGNLADILRNSVLSQRGAVIVDRRTNTLIIKELPDYMDTVIALIENLDTPEPQVMIEARIVETTKRFTRTLGVDWAIAGEASAALGNTTGLEFPNNIEGTGGVQLLTGAQNGFLGISLGNVLNSFTLDATLQAAETQGLINILSAPKVATLNNEQASIQSGLQIPIQTVANNTVSVQFINATLRLDVTPHVTAEGTVLMDINIQKREPQLAFAVVGATNAPIATKEARTRVIVRDGGTTVIGGIYEVSTDQGSDRVPGLSNVPILGHLFKNQRRTDENEELLIFITPRVIKL